MGKAQLILRILLVALWIRVTFEYVAQMIAPAIKPAFPLVALAFDTVVVLLGCWTIRHRRDIIIAALFIAATFFSTIIVNGYGLEMYFNGMRDFIGYIFVIPILRYFIDDDDLRDNFTHTVDRHLLIFLIAQAPCLITQYIRWGAGDTGGGTLGDNSGFITTLIYLISFYLMQRRFDPERPWHSIRQHYYLILLLLPTLLNETKVSFVFMAMYILLLMPLGRKTFKRTLIAIPVALLAIYAGAVAFVSITAGVMGDVDDIFSLDYYMEGYLMSADSDDTERLVKWLIEEDDEANVAAGLVPDVPRITKMQVLPDLLDDNTRWAFGRGVGHFKGGTMIAGSDFYIENQWVLVGSIPYIYHLLIQLGGMGVALMTLFFVVNMGMKPREGLRRQHNLQLYLLGLILIIQLYQDTLRNAYICLFIYYVMMMAWLPAEPQEEEADR